MLAKFEMCTLISFRGENKCTYWGSGGVCPRILKLGEWSALRLGQSTPGERPPCIHWMEGCVGFRDGLDTLSRRKIPSPCRKSNHGRPAHSLVTIMTELQRLRI